MVRRFVLLPFLAFGFVLAAGAQDPKDTKDEKKTEASKSTVIKAPEGWKFIKAKDGSYAFLIPKDVKSEKTSEGTFKNGGFNGKKDEFSAACGTHGGRRSGAFVAHESKRVSVKERRCGF